MIVTKIKKLRDPFIVLHEGVYYAYGTGETGTDWANTPLTLYKNTSGDLRGDWERVENLAVIPPYAEKNFWAPEVYLYRGKWYMFTTYFSSKTGRKGCTVLAADSPEGPFREISDGHITPADWECLDGTLYIDEENRPWLVFVKEWKCTEDGMGRMMACRLSQDLKCLEGEITELFSAPEPAWCRGRKVTDGCFMVKTKTGKLLMIWSNGSEHGYCVGISESESGKVTGPWKHGDLLYSRLYSGDYDGGHGMIFTTLEGEKMMSVHSPNRPAPDGTEERVILVPIEDTGDSLRWKK